MANNNTSVKVAIKVRPLIKRERDQKLNAQWRIQGHSIECINPVCPNLKFSFDQICDENSSTLDLFNKVTKPIVESSVNGFNGTIFAYGQTSSGKTHTMLGNSMEAGITLLAIRQIFESMNNKSNRTYLLRVSYIEIYNERIYDLFNKRNELKIQEIGNGDVNVNCVEKFVNSEESIMELLHQGNKERKVAETNMNVQSSRSHTIFSIIIESQERGDSINENVENDSAVQISVLNLVDLAGSERAEATGATGSRLKEGSHINKSLLSLSMVINKLSEDPDQQKFINYRDSKLTRILQPSLGGNAMTAIICTITPAAIEETNYTLGFANRAKNIKNKPIVNEVLSEAVMMKRMHKQIAGLEEELVKERNKCKRIERDLFERKDKIIRYKEKPLKVNRRRTWAPAPTENGTNTDLDDHSSTESFKVPSKPEQLGEFGHQIEYTEEEFNSIIDSSFSNNSTPSMAINTEIYRKRDCIRTSLLKTPRSFRKSIVNNVSLENSPVNHLDKDKRIKSLECELEELQQYQKIESVNFNMTLEDKTEIISDLTRKLESVIKEHADEIAGLTASLETAQHDHIQFEKAVKKLEKDFAEAQKAKALAECNLTGTEFEYEQYKIRSKRREMELVNQIDEKTQETIIKQLNDKIKEMNEKGKQLETINWENEKQFKNEIQQNMDKMGGLEKSIDTLKVQLEMSELSATHNFKQMTEKYDKLQQEYDEVSSQLVDNIQENDDLQSQIKLIESKAVALQTTIAELNTALKEANNNFAEEQKRVESLKQENFNIKTDLEEHKNKSMNNNIMSAKPISPERVKEIKELNNGFDIVCILSTYYIVQCDALKLALDTSKANTESVNTQLRNELEGLRKTLAEIEALSTEQIDCLTKQHEQATHELTEDHKTAIENMMHEHLMAIEILNEQLAILKSEHLNVQMRCDALEREKGMLEQICNNSRITIQFAVNELSILRHSYCELEMSVAKQELDNLKLQKTICDNDDTFMIIDNDNSVSVNNELTREINGSIAQSTQIAEPCDECESMQLQLDATNDKFHTKYAIYENEMKMLEECLMDVTDFESDEIGGDKTILLQKIDWLKIKYVEYNRVRDILNSNNEFSFLDIEPCNNIEETLVMLQQKCAQIQSELQLKSDAVQQLTEKNSALETANHQISSNNNNLKIEIEQNAARIDDLSSEKIKTSEQLKNMFNETKNVREELENEKVIEQQLQIEVTDLSEKIEQLEEKYKQLETLNSDLTKELEQLQLNERDKSQLNQELVESRNEMNTFKEQLANKDNEIQSLSDIKLKITIELHEKIAQIESLEQSNDEFEKQVSDTSKQLVELTHELSVLKEMNSNNTDKQRTIDELSNKILVLEGERITLDHENDKLNKTVSNLRMQCDSLTAEQSKNEKELNELLEKFASAIDKLAQQSTQLEKEQQNSVNNAEKIDCLIAKVKLLEDEQETLENENTKLNSIVKEQQTQMKQLEREINESEQLKSKLLRFNELSAENNNVKLELSCKVAELKILQSEKIEGNHLRQTVELLRKKIKLADEVHNKLEHANNQLNDTIETQRAEINQLKQLISEGPKLAEHKQENRILTIKSENYENLRKSKSPAKGPHAAIDVDHLLRENLHLKTSHQRLIDELDEVRTLSRQDRKSKRHSTHDDTRRISGFDTNLIEMETQTDPTDELCRCTEFDAIIKQLKRNILIKDAQFNTFKLHTGIEAIKSENEDLKSKLSTAKSELCKAHMAHERLLDKYEEMERKYSAIYSKPLKRSCVHVMTQTIATTEQIQNENAIPNAGSSSYVAEIDFYKMSDKYQAAKKKFIALKENYDKLQNEYQSIEQQLTERNQKLETIEKDQMILRNKYEQGKLICMSRGTEMERLGRIQQEAKTQLESTKQELATQVTKFDSLQKNLENIQQKYNNAKKIIHHLNEKNQRLQQSVDLE